jgi:hypothetical protein
MLHASEKKGRPVAVPLAGPPQKVGVWFPQFKHASPNRVKPSVLASRASFHEFVDPGAGLGNEWRQPFHDGARSNSIAMRGLRRGT